MGRDRERGNQAISTSTGQMDSRASDAASQTPFGAGLFFLGGGGATYVMVGLRGGVAGRRERKVGL